MLNLSSLHPVKFYIILSLNFLISCFSFSTSVLSPEVSSLCHDVDRPELCQLTDPTIEIVSTSPSVLPLGMRTKRSSFVFQRNKYFPLGENMTKTKYYKFAINTKLCNIS